MGKCSNVSCQNCFVWAVGFKRAGVQKTVQERLIMKILLVHFQVTEEWHRIDLEYLPQSFDYRSLGNWMKLVGNTTSGKDNPTELLGYHFWTTRVCTVMIDFWLSIIIMQLLLWFFCWCWWCLLMYFVVLVVIPYTDLYGLVVISLIAVSFSYCNRPHWIYNVHVWNTSTIET